MASTNRAASSRAGAKPLAGASSASLLLTVRALKTYVGKTATSTRTKTAYAARMEGSTFVLDATRVGQAKKSLKVSDREFSIVAPDALAAFGGVPASLTRPPPATTTPATPAPPPAWTTKPLVAEVFAIVGWSGSSGSMSYVVGKQTLDNLEAPVIKVTGPGPTDAPETKEYLPTSEYWEGNARSVLALKAAPAPASVPASDTFVPSSESVPSTPTSTSTDLVPASDLAPSASVPLEQVAQDIVADAGLDTKVPADATTVSSTLPSPTPQGGFLSKYKWWLAAGGVAAAGYVLLHRSNPGTYPLPAALSKLVR